MNKVIARHNTLIWNYREPNARWRFTMRLPGEAIYAYLYDPCCVDAVLKHLPAEFTAIRKRLNAEGGPSGVGTLNRERTYYNRMGRQGSATVTPVNHQGT